MSMVIVVLASFFKLQKGKMNINEEMHQNGDYLVHFLTRQGILLHQKVQFRANSAICNAGSSIKSC